MKIRLSRLGSHAQQKSDYKNLQDVAPKQTPICYLMQFKTKLCSLQNVKEMIMIFLHIHGHITKMWKLEKSAFLIQNGGI